MIHKMMLSEPVLLGRDSEDRIFALRDTCPHRGTLLSRGTFDGNEVECPYHGWRFGVDGQCKAIPSQLADQRPQPDDIRTNVFPVKEIQGNIWIYFGKLNDKLPEIPLVPAVGGKYRMHLSMIFDCGIDLAVTGLMDPAHGAFVHSSLIWRNREDLQEKNKVFSPLPMGWRMDRHPVSSNSRAYRIFLGGKPETEISYTLPSVRIEHTRTDKFNYCGLTACTPVDDHHTEVHHVMYWDLPGTVILKPIVGRIAKRFLDQDRRAILDMEAGRRFSPTTMLIKDADTQIRWYYLLKQEFVAAQKEKRAFRNPIQPLSLRWRS